MRQRQKGFTLIEALIAVLVLSVGLLGVAAMQLRALQSAHMGYQRAVVSLAAIDAQERAWASLSETKSCPGGSTLSTMGSDWLGEWFGSGKVLANAGSSVASSPSCEYTVTIGWQEERYSDEENGVPFAYQFRLPVL
ncbi:type IV pilus modification protein PilV [Halomonas sp. LR3S48]|uniref:type IV pilus modification protein PilV n=1 Tax=Halomonas sp. LR3S48 TaxID=2982694 RepID=UPI0021E4F6D2|nr:type IV pilus modification protein PilV [Halomonas sp. LR3S48]UYG03197.1 type IV pilus modification protein PilV [Halomonas sp. LR3S48]